MCCKSWLLEAYLLCLSPLELNFYDRILGHVERPDLGVEHLHKTHRGKSTEALIFIEAARQGVFRLVFYFGPVREVIDIGVAELPHELYEVEVLKKHHISEFLVDTEILKACLIKIQVAAVQD